MAAMSVRLVWLFLAAACLAFWVVFAVGAHTLIRGERCERGAVSAIGPVSLVDGRLVGDTTPEVRCLP